MHNAHWKHKRKNVLYLVFLNCFSPVFHADFLLTFTLIHFTTPYIPFTMCPYLSPSLHFTSLHFTRLHLLHYRTSDITFLNLFLNAVELHGSCSSTTAGNWFQSSMVLFTNEYFPMSVLYMWHWSSLRRWIWTIQYSRMWSRVVA